MSKILITGGVGFIGFHIAKKLASNIGNEITIVDNLHRGRYDEDFIELINLNNVKFINCDITNPNAFFNIGYDFDYIYHLAAIIGVKNVMNNPDKVLSVNATTILNLFEYAKLLPNLKKILFSSTSEIYSGTLRHYGIKFPTPEDVNLTINDISSPRTTYALSKMFGESVCFNYGAKYNIPFTIVRYHNVYGPRMGFAHVIPELMVKIHKNTEINLPSPEHSRAFCYIDDATEMSVRSCENQNTINEIFHIGNSDNEITMFDLVKIISNVMNKEIIVNKLSNTEGSPSRRCPDTTKVRKLLNYNPIISLSEGIRKTYSWYYGKFGDIYE